MMSATMDPGMEIAKRLQESLDRLRADISRADIWAGALHGLGSPVPEYRVDSRYVLPPVDDGAVQPTVSQSGAKIKSE